MVACGQDRWGHHDKPVRAVGKDSGEEGSMVWRPPAYATVEIEEGTADMV